MAQGQFSPLFSRRTPGGIYTVQGIDQVPGKVWFVNSATGSDTSGAGQSPDSPFDSLAYAYSSDVLSSGDVVYVMPGHTESITGAGTVTADIAGTTVIGLGTGASRPTFNFTATGSTFAVSGAGVKLVNLLTVANTAVDVVQGIIVTGADCQLIDIEGREDGTTKQFADWMAIHTGAARCKVIRPRFRGAAGDGGQSAIQVTAVVDGVEIRDAVIYGTFTAGGIETTAANTDMLIDRAIVRQAHATQDGGIVLNSGTTGWVVDPKIWSATNDANGFNLAIVAAGAAVYGALVVNLAGESGGAWGTASAAA
jgi:hypothetical protein